MPLGKRRAWKTLSPRGAPVQSVRLTVPRASVELTPSGGLVIDQEQTPTESRWIVHGAPGRPLSFSLATRGSRAPYRRMLDMLERANADGLPMRGQVAARAEEMNGHAVANECVVLNHAVFGIADQRDPCFSVVVEVIVPDRIAVAPIISIEQIGACQQITS